MLRIRQCQRTAVAKANDPEHAHRLAACWNAFLQAETTEIERIDDGLWDMNDVLLAGNPCGTLHFPMLRGFERVKKIYV